MRFASRFAAVGCCSLFAFYAIEVCADDQAVGTSTIRVTSTLRTMPSYDVRQATMKERSLPVIKLTAVSHEDHPPAAPSSVVAAKNMPAAPGETARSDAPPQPSALQESPRDKSDLAAVKLPLQRGRKPANVVVHTVAEPQVTNQARQALNFFGGNQARTTLSQFPRRTPIQAGPAQPIRRQIKPFQTIPREPTVSPYLNLYREENDTESAPTYYAFVLPQQEQIEANRLQQTEIQQLTRQLQNRSDTIAMPQRRAAAMPGTGTPARYRDTAQFYDGWSR